MSNPSSHSHSPSPDAIAAPLEAVLCTERLSRRAQRRPDYAGENRGLARLAQALADAPDSVFQTLAEVVLMAVHADSAGVSLLSEDGSSFHWPAIAGAWQSQIGGRGPRHGGPWGDVLDRDAPLLFNHPQRRYARLAPGAPEMVECLLVPLHVKGRAVGALWAVTHAAPNHTPHEFDSEDLRQLTSLCSCAAAAYQAQAMLRALEQRDTAVKQSALELSQSALERQRANTAGPARRAALNLMEDAVEARRAAEASNAELRGSEVRLARELGALRQLQAISALLIEGGDTDAVYERILDAAVALMHAAGASLHAFDHESNLRRTLALREVGPPSSHAGSASAAARAHPSCDEAQRLGRRVVVPDVEECDFLAGTPALAELRTLGIRALQSTPLISRSGHLLGVMSTHWRKPHEASDTELRALDILTRQAADLIERKRTEDATARLAAIVASSDDAIIAKDLDGTIISWNHGAEQLFGYTAAEAIGKPVTLLIPHDHLHEESEILARIRRGEPVSHYETVRQRKAGGLIDVSLTVSPVRDLSGRIIGASKIARDITESKRAEHALRESELQLRFMAESMPQKIFTAKADGHDQYLNQQWMEYAGLSFEVMKERGWMQIVHPDDTAQTRLLWQQCLATGEPFQAEHRCRRADGRYRWHLSRAHAMRDPLGQIALWIGSSTDVQDVKEADQRKDEFLAMLAHELRNPLAPVIHAAELLRTPNLEESASRRAAEVIQRQTARMARLIDDLLDVSRITRGKVELRRQRVDLRAAIAAAVETNEPRMLKKRQRFHGPELADPIWLDADPVRLEQVISNLIDNAVKYTPAAGRIDLTVEREGDWAIARVRDQGLGISAEMLPHIFGLFAQEKRGNVSDGLGIGLTVVLNLVALHGGTIAAQSAGPGRGSEFTLRLPVLTAAAEPAPTQAPESVATAASRLRILVVEDNEDAAEILTRLLESWGHELRSVAEGEAACAAASAFQPDLVLLDVGLPGISGYEVARDLRRLTALPGMRIVAMTGFGQDSDRQRSRDAAFDEHLVKPVSVEALRQALARH